MYTYIVLIYMHAYTHTHRYTDTLTQGTGSSFLPRSSLKCLSAWLHTCGQVLLHLHCPVAYSPCYSVILMRIYGPGVAVALPKQL